MTENRELPIPDPLSIVIAEQSLNWRRILDYHNAFFYP